MVLLTTALKYLHADIDSVSEVEIVTVEAATCLVLPREPIRVQISGFGSHIIEKHPV